MTEFQVGDIVRLTIETIFASHHDDAGADDE